GFSLYQTVDTEAIDTLVINSDAPTIVGQPTHLNATVTAGNKLSYVWDFGDGSPAQAAPYLVSHIYDTVGTYTVQITVSNELGSETSSATVVVEDAPPVASFTSNGLTLLGQTTSFTNSATGTNLTYLWNFGDDTTSTDANPSHVYPTTGTFTVSLTVSNGAGHDVYESTVDIEMPVLDPLLYLTIDGGDTYGLGSLDVRNEDIVSYNYDTQNFAMVFDGSLHNLEPSVHAIHVVDENTILMSFWNEVTLPQVGTVDEWDIVQYTQSESGETFSLYFDGEDVGLGTGDGVISDADKEEDIDALMILADGRLLISTHGNPDVPGVSGARDEDVLVFTPDPNGLGENTAGTWDIYFDSSDVDLTTSDEGITGFHIVEEEQQVIDQGQQVTAQGQVYLSTRGSFSIPGLSGPDEDVIVCTLITSGDTTRCINPSRYFDGSSADSTLSGLDIQGLSLHTPAPELPISGLRLTNEGPTSIGQSVGLTAMVDTGEDITYTWDFGDVSGLSTSNHYLLHTYIDVGTYTVVVTASNHINSRTATTEVIVGDGPPTASFITSNPNYLGYSTIFTSTSISNNLTYLWDFCDGTTSTEATPTHIYNALGTYTPTLTIDNGWGSDTFTETIEIIEGSPNLVAYWKLDEEGGTRVDSSGRGNDLAPKNGLSNKIGQIGRAVDLEADDEDYLEAINGPDITGSLTLVGWMQPESFGSNDSYRVIASKYDYGTNERSYRFDIRNGGDKLGFIASHNGASYTTLEGNVANVLQSQSSLQTGTWYHVAAVFDIDATAQQAEMRIYLNGEELASRLFTHKTLHQSDALFALGANFQNGNEKFTFDGLLDEWRVYDVALTEADIQGLMNIAPPIVDFTATPQETTMLDSITFTTTSNSAIQLYEWDFGDGTTAVRTNPEITHAYEEPGIYNIVLTAQGLYEDVTITKTNYITVTTIDGIREHMIDEDGGVIDLPGDGIHIIFPAGAVTETVVITTYTNLDEYYVESVGKTPIKSFFAEGMSLSSGQSYNYFNQPLTVTVAYDPATACGNDPACEEKLTLFWRHTLHGTWHALKSSQLISETNEVQITTTQLGALISLLSATGSILAPPEDLRLPSVTAASVSEFTGAATFNIPIDIPLVAGGDLLNLSLNYSSEAVNSIRGNTEPRGRGLDTYVTQSSIYGLGWDLSGLASIGVAPTGPFGRIMPIPSININGSYPLYYDHQTGEWHTQPLSFLKVDNGKTFDDDWVTNEQWDKINDFYWDTEDGIPDGHLQNIDPDPYQVWDHDGTRYTFAQRQHSWSGANCDEKEEHRAHAFYVTEIKDVHDNRIEIDYLRVRDDGKCEPVFEKRGDNIHYDRAILPELIQFYPSASGGGEGDTPTVQIRFVTDSRSDIYMRQEQYFLREEVGQPFYAERRITAIVVEVKNGDQADNWQIYRTYSLDNAHYVTKAQSGEGVGDYQHMLLKAVQIYGGLGTGPNDTIQDIKFNYTAEDAIPLTEWENRSDWDGPPGQYAWNYSRLKEIDTGLGGTIKFSYKDGPEMAGGICDGFYNPVEDPPWADLDDFDGMQKHLDRYVVDEIKTYDGHTSGAVATVKYDYAE
ncbi:MAG: PKD domain-containing protein, partial [Chloroflexota bacterium]